MTRGALVAVVATISLLWAAGCSSDDGALVTTTVPAASTTLETVATAPPTSEDLPGPSLSDHLEFIEVSARLGLGDDADLVALAVDVETLDVIGFDDQVGLDDGAAVPAWCTGADPALADSEDPIPSFLLRIGPPGLDVTAGGAERFELRTGEITLGQGPVSAEFELVVDGRVHRVPDAELDLGDSANAGTFRGVSDDGLLIEGAFLCG